MLEQLLPGKVLAGAAGIGRDVLVQMHVRRAQDHSILVPAVAEPLLVWVVSGEALVSERDPGGPWRSLPARAGDFYLTDSDTPYELAWQPRGGDSFVVLHLYLGLPLLERATRECLGAGAGRAALREVSAGRDETISALLSMMRLELERAGPSSPLLLQGLGQALAVHLVRHHGGAEARRDNALPAYRLRRAVQWMQSHLAGPFSLEALARQLGMSPFHFSRLFRRATGQAPSQYFIGLRMAEARRLLRETDRSIIGIGLEVGYSSPSHFAQVFRRASGMTPREYRG
jgi:AraC family transcriptional regulator